MAHLRYELEVQLLEIEPAIWRRLELPGSSSLETVHYALQVAMGWTNSHLHLFEIGKRRYGMARGDDLGEMELEDERDHRLQDVVGDGEAFVYEYDFGDGWRHEVKVVQVSTVAKPVKPRCLAGARACPPDDCGGPSGYQEMVEALANPRHERHDELTEWAEGFEPERFTLPKGGMELRAEIDHYRDLAEQGRSGDEDEDEGGVVGAAVAVPRALVEAVLALEPMQRASLAAVIAGSLAEDVIRAQQMTRQIVSVMRTGARGGWTRDPKHAKAASAKKTGRKKHG